MIKIITDSVSSISRAKAQEAHLEIMTLYVHRDGVEYADATMDLDKFYADIYNMLDDIPTSSQPSPHSWQDVFERAAQAGDEVLGVFISSGLSGTYDSAVRAARAVKSRNINFSYALIDSASCGYDEAWPVWAAVEAREAKKTLAGCVDAALHSMACSRLLFAPETLTFLQKGGRIGNAAALLGNLIQLAPVLTVTDGKATTLMKVRTRKKALEKMVHTFIQDRDNFGLKRVVVQYIGDKTPAIQWAHDVMAPLIGHSVDVLPVSPVIGLHVGPAVALAYECDHALAGKLTQSARMRLSTS